MKLKLCKHENTPLSHRVNLKGETGDYGYWVIECICRKGIEKAELTGGVKYIESVHAQNEEDATREWNNRPSEKVARVERMKDFHKVEDKLPNTDGEDVLVLYEDNNGYPGYSIGWYSGTWEAQVAFRRITHWQPLLFINKLIKETE